ncbi:MAG TPA: DUF4398 domain-containing protein [bacterium]|nr:DUF4398 domain-containing protein [bacterium]
MVRRLFLFVLTLLCLAVWSGCASVPTVPDITDVQVREALQAAKVSGAELKSPYEFRSAQLYYERALVEQENGHRKAARLYLNRAYDQANLAYNNAIKFRKAP